VARKLDALVWRDGIAVEYSLSRAAGSHVVAEIHYRRADEIVEDRSTLGLYLAPKAANRPVDLVVDTKAEGAVDGRTQKVTGQSSWRRIRTCSLSSLRFRPVSNRWTSQPGSRTARCRCCWW